MPDITHIFPVKAEPSKVFDAFCTPQGLDNWWPLKSAGEPKPDKTYTFYFGPEHDWRAKVVQVDNGKSLTWKMTQAIDDWVDTEVGFKLEPKGEDTQVTFFHKGWREASEHFGISTFCWGQLLNGLKNYVERGIVIPHHQRN